MVGWVPWAPWDSQAPYDADIVAPGGFLCSHFSFLNQRVCFGFKRMRFDGRDPPSELRAEILYRIPVSMPPVFLATHLVTMSCHFCCLGVAGAARTPSAPLGGLIKTVLLLKNSSIDIFVVVSPQLVVVTPQQVVVTPKPSFWTPKMVRKT